MGLSRTRKLALTCVLAATVVGLCATSLPYRAELAVIELYTRIGSPVMGLIAKCRYEQTCSQLALQSLREEGFLRGNLLIAKRLLGCSPIGAIWEELFQAEFRNPKIQETR